MKEINKFHIILLDDISDKDLIQYDILSSNSKIFLNGDWYGVSNDIKTVNQHLINCRRCGIINIYVSIMRLLLCKLSFTSVLFCYLNIYLHHIVMQIFFKCENVQN